jgi:hypothetical protein
MEIIGSIDGKETVWVDYTCLISNNLSVYFKVGALLFAHRVHSYVSHH